MPTIKSPSCKYVVDEQTIGEGSYGVVFRTMDNENAIKIQSKPKMNGTMNEIIAMRTLNNDNII